jgi:hypothetical protein
MRWKICQFLTLALDMVVVKDRLTVLLPVHMETPVEATLFVKNFPSLISHPILSISEIFLSMQLSPMSRISLQTVNAPMSELLRTKWR